MSCKNALFLLIMVVKSCDPLTVEERQEFVNIHNYLRRSVVPEAGDMQEVAYNTNIEATVEAYLDLCKFEHRKLEGYGENGRLATDKNITDTVFSWFQERVYFDIALPSENPKRCSRENSDVDYLGEVQCGHYVMMAKSTIKSIGCGYKFCKTITAGATTYNDSYITFCFYNSGQKNPPYETGKHCSSCDNAYKSCYHGLCVPNNFYNKTLVTCKRQCQNCGTRFLPLANCLYECPEGTNDGGCTGKPKIADPKCSPCLRIDESCRNGGKEDVTSAACKCNCTEGFQGSFCEVRKDWQMNSYEHRIDGLPWRYNMTTPANILQFRNSFHEFQRTISKDASERCASRTSNDEIGNKCRELSGKTIHPEGVRLIPGYPSLLKNGSLILQMFLNYSSDAGGSKEEKFVSPLILQEVWKTPSTDLNNLIENVRRIYQKSREEASRTTSKDVTTSTMTSTTTTTTSSNRTEPTKSSWCTIPIMNRYSFVISAVIPMILY